MRELWISGEVFSDEASLIRFSADMSHYAIKPKLVVVPRNEADIAEIVVYAKQEKLPLTPRGAGSNQSGSSVGSGIVVLFSKMISLNAKQGRRVKVQPGIVHQQLDLQLHKDGLRLPYDPSSRMFCTIGGNVATKASGLRSIKYGNVDSALKSLRFYDTTHGLIDTSNRLPETFEKAILQLRDRLRNDKETTQILHSRRNLKSSSGYNLQSFYACEAPEDIVTHLLAGSVGTLGVFSEIELEAVPAPKSANLYLLYFPSLAEAAKDVMKLKGFGPAAIEILDSYGVDLIRTKSELDVPQLAQAVLLVEFDSDLERADHLMLSHLREKAVSFHVEAEPKRQAELWRIRENMLLWIMGTLETAENRFPPLADDLAVPVSRLPEFITEIQHMLKQYGTVAVIFGHVGEGNLHIRPMIKKENWEENLRKLSDLVFNVALRYGGTITGEHGLGRNRSKYLRSEWGDKIYSYFVEIKRVFDPMDLLNPEVVFTSEDLTRNLRI